MNGDSVLDRRAELAHLNLMAVNEVLTRAEPGGVVDREGDELLYANERDFSILNGAMRSGAGDAAAFAERASRFFAGRRGWMAFVHPDDAAFEDAVRAVGLTHVADYPEMTCSTALPEDEAPEGVELYPVGDAAEAREYWSVCEQAYASLGFPPGVFEGFSAELLLREDVAACLARVDGVTAAAAMIVLAGTVGMVAWVATLEEQRGRGLGALCTVRVTNAAFERGAELASLQASPMGRSLYLALGYEELFQYRLFLSGRFA
jgi:GNAT superfamily N-acetyltransferase